ncbi:hypothetical protein [Zoogloea sp.]|uniref:hypothetical protein n=1 Tax=Zoogloea sp. TaxID=49181 RepID=UPI0026329B60|nr:hypothetical protein [Zoogloea sp.]MDD3352658.1 hypothetical protein [Zoogloea sp.]
MKRSHLLLLALAASLGAAGWVAGLDAGDEVIAPVPGRAAPRTPGPVAVDLTGLARVERLGYGAPTDPPANLFAERSFQPEPPPPPPAQPPSAPPLPFRYGGMLEDGGPPAAFLVEGGHLRAVRAGDLVEGRYRVVAVSRSRIDFVYLPLNQTQSLLTGAIP